MRRLMSVTGVFSKHLRETVLKDYVFVLTSTHAAQMERLVGRAAQCTSVKPALATIQRSKVLVSAA